MLQVGRTLASLLPDPTDTPVDCIIRQTRSASLLKTPLARRHCLSGTETNIHRSCPSGTVRISAVVSPSVSTLSAIQSVWQCPVFPQFIPSDSVQVSALHSVRKCPVFPQFIPSGSVQFFRSSFCPEVSSFSAVYSVRQCPGFRTSFCPEVSSLSAVHSFRQCPVFPHFIPSGSVQFFRTSFRPAVSSFSAVHSVRQCPVFSALHSVRHCPVFSALHSFRQCPVFPQFSPSSFPTQCPVTPAAPRSVPWPPNLLNVFDTVFPLSY